MSNIQEFENSIPEEGLFLIDFYADWCMPCKMMMPAIEEIAKKYDGKITIGKINIEKNSSIAKENGINSIPTLIIFKNGENVKEVIGLKNAEEISLIIDEFL